MFPVFRLKCKTDTFMLEHCFSVQDCKNVFLFEMTHYTLDNVTRVPHHNNIQCRELGLENAIHFTSTLQHIE